MSPVIQIIAGHAVRFSTNNGITVTEYDDGELYEVPPFVAEGMKRRGWAKDAVIPREPEREPEPAPKETPKDEPDHKKRR